MSLEYIQSILLEKKSRLSSSIKTITWIVLLYRCLRCPHVIYGSFSHFENQMIALFSQRKRNMYSCDNNHVTAAAGVRIFCLQYGTGTSESGPFWKYLIASQIENSLTLITLCANSSEDKLMIFFLFLSRKQVLTFHTNCLVRRQIAWNIKASFLGKIKNRKLKCRLVKVLPSMLSV